jgi:hypothetical protein
VHERAVVEVVAGEVLVSAGDAETTCAAGTLLTFAPGERHAVRAARGAAAADAGAVARGGALPGRRGCRRGQDAVAGQRRADPLTALPIRVSSAV